MPTNNDEIQNQAKSIFDSIAFTPFQQCQPLSRDFSDIPNRPGIYAVRHRVQGLLYIGKTKNLRSRFKGGHKAFLWAWLDQYNSLRCPNCYADNTLLEKPCAIIGTRSDHFESN